jgi:lipopolysaccharide/colanic/teichoic acid biosynthesis glycosyltransferase
VLLGASPEARRLILAAVKRAFDIVIGCLILIVAAPAMMMIALCVVLESRGPVFYRARRVGRSGEKLDVLKFRKMRNGATGRPLTLVEDERFTRLGHWLARTKLDELPQLLNVLRGDMSLIGPRPEDPRFVQRHAEAFQAILEVRPGITGLSQLAYRAESRILDPDDPVADYEQRVLPQKLYLDRLYVERGTPLLDLRILAWTIAVTLGIPVSVNRSTAGIRPRLGRGGRRQPAAASMRNATGGEAAAVVASSPDLSRQEV